MSYSRKQIEAAREVIMDHFGVDERYNDFQLVDQRWRITASVFIIPMIAPRSCRFYIYLAIIKNTLFQKAWLLGILATAT